MKTELKSQILILFGHKIIPWSSEWNAIQFEDHFEDHFGFSLEENRDYFKVDLGILLRPGIQELYRSVRLVCEPINTPQVLIQEILISIYQELS